GGARFRDRDRPCPPGDLGSGALQGVLRRSSRPGRDHRAAGSPLHVQGRLSPPRRGEHLGQAGPAGRGPRRADRHALVRDRAARPCWHCRAGGGLWRGCRSAARHHRSERAGDPVRTGRMTARRRTMRRVAGALVALIILVPLPCVAIDWLVFVVDRSNSIDERELALQRNAYIRLLSDAAVISALGDTHVAIVEFDTHPEIVVDWTDPESAARQYLRKWPVGLRGQTGIGGALGTALALLVGKSGRLLIDISGDGKDNVDSMLLEKMRATADEQGVEINGLAIMTPDVPEIDRYYSRQVVNGFVLPVEKDGDFQSALKRKLFYEVAGTRPPAETHEVDLAVAER